MFSRIHTEWVRGDIKDRCLRDFFTIKRVRKDQERGTQGKLCLHHSRCVPHFLHLSTATEEPTFASSYTLISVCCSLYLLCVFYLTFAHSPCPEVTNRVADPNIQKKLDLHT